MYMDAIAKMGVGGAHPGGLALTKKLVEKEQITQDHYVLDIGCGTGLTSAYLYEQFRCRVAACDIHSIMIEKANQRFQKKGIPIKAIYGNAHSLPFQDESFDYIISESVTSFTSIERSIKEYHRILKPNGKLIAIELSLNEGISEDNIRKYKQFYRLKKLLTIKNWNEVLSKKNFSSINIRPYKINLNKLETSNDFQPIANLSMEVYDAIIEHEDITKEFLSKVGPCIINAIK